MTSIKKINNSEIKKQILSPKSTGYAAAGALFISGISSFSKNKIVRKKHKIFGITSGILTLLHIGTLKYLSFKYKKL